MAAELGAQTFPGFSLSAMGLMLDHAWPGNVRELRNTVERAVYRAHATDPALADVIDALTLDPFESPWRPTGLSRSAPPEEQDPAAAVAPRSPPAPAPRIDTPFEEQTRVFETAILRGALAAEGGHQGKAAERLGLTYHQFRGLMRKHGVGSPRTRARPAEAR